MSSVYLNWLNRSNCNKTEYFFRCSWCNHTSVFFDVSEPMHTEGVVAQRRATDPWRKNYYTVYPYVACTLQATLRGVQEKRRTGLEPVLIHCSTAHRARGVLRGANHAAFGVQGA